MEIYGLPKLSKFRSKNLGNSKLIAEIDKFIETITYYKFEDYKSLNKIRPDSDLVYKGNFYFFDIDHSRLLSLIEFKENELFIIWVGSHKEYERTFKNNRNVIRKWLKDNDWIK